jgi:mRNA interferase MazF
VVLVDYVFAGKPGSKHRPALVISSNTYNQRRQDLILAGITSRARNLPGDTSVEEWEVAGLLRPSTVSGEIRTFKQFEIIRKLGAISHRDMQSVEESLRLTIDLK